MSEFLPLPDWMVEKLKDISKFELACSEFVGKVEIEEKINEGDIPSQDKAYKQRVKDFYFKLMEMGFIQS